jgi:hypothetical protein
MPAPLSPPPDVAVFAAPEPVYAASPLGEGDPHLRSVVSVNGYHDMR